jgi:hypothetical protein
MNANEPIPTSAISNKTNVMVMTLESLVRLGVGVVAEPVVEAALILLPAL